MRLALLFFVAAASLSSQALPTGFLRGVLVANESSSPGDQFLLQPEHGKVYRFRFDQRTWIEREKERIPGSALRVGELLEVVTDRDPKAMFEVHYARMVHVIEKRVVRPPPPAGVFRFYKHPTEEAWITPQLSFTGVISHLASGEFTLKTRLDGNKRVLLRPDTMFLQSGGQVETMALQQNLRVCVWAAKNREGELEAYQVMWGEILQPNQP